MEQLMMGLKDVMQQELTAYKEILVKAVQKKEALLCNDVVALDHIVAFEWNLVGTVTQLEKEREKLIGQVAAAAGLDQATVRLGDITALLEAGQRAQFAQMGDELACVLSDIEALNTANRELVDTHLKYSTFCVNLLTGHMGTLGTYSHAGRISDTQERATLVFDRMV